MKIIFLGTGTSQGVPVIGCKCEVCRSEDPRDKRLRTSIFMEVQGSNIVVDAGPDFRQQMLREQISKLDAILITHEHNDHIIGLDDVRPFNFITRTKMPIFATSGVQKSLKTRFAYAFDPNPYPGAPGFHLHTISKNNAFDVDVVKIIPIEVIHGKMPVLGFRIGDFTYITDAKSIADQELEKVKGTKVLVLNALRHDPHYSHLNLKEALEIVEIIAPEKAYFTHVSHAMGLTAAINDSLPENVMLAHDGLRITI